LIGTKQILAIGLLTALAVVGASTMTFGVAFAQNGGQDKDQDFSGGCVDDADCKNHQLNQWEDNANNIVGDIFFD
jgi:hypothetical protein